MAIILNKVQLCDLLGKLGSYPTSIVAKGELETRLKQHVSNFDFIVDAWPDFKALILRPSLDSIETYIMVFALDVFALHLLLQHPGIVDWTQKVKVAALDMRLSTTVCDVIQLQRMSVNMPSEFSILTVTNCTLNTRCVPDDFTLSSLSPNQSKIVNANWARRNVGTENYIHFLLKTFPSCALYDNSGHLVSYVLSYHYGCLGILYVEAECRGKGYGKIVVSQLAKQCLQFRDMVYVVVESSHNASLKLHSDLGFSREDIDVCWITGK